MNLQESTDGILFPWGLLLAAVAHALYVRDKSSYLELAFFFLFSGQRRWSRREGKGDPTGDSHYYVTNQTEDTSSRLY